MHNVSINFCFTLLPCSCFFSFVERNCKLLRLYSVDGWQMIALSEWSNGGIILHYFMNMPSFNDYNNPKGTE